MKNKLICQSTIFDCGPTSITNALRFLFDREEILPMLVKQVWLMSLDTYGDDGSPCKEGTSKASMRYMADWFNYFSEKQHFPLKSKFLELDNALIEKGSSVWNCLDHGGCAVVRVWYKGTGHYVLLTQLLSDNLIGLFDPYEEETLESDPNWRPVFDDPCRKNREVRADLFNHTEVITYAMGEPERREVLLLWRTDR